MVDLVRDPLIARLTADATLRGYLGATVAAPRIYPEWTPHPWPLLNADTPAFVTLVSMGDVGTDLYIPDSEGYNMTPGDEEYALSVWARLLNRGDRAFRRAAYLLENFGPEGDSGKAQRMVRVSPARQFSERDPKDDAPLHRWTQFWRAGLTVQTSFA